MSVALEPIQNLYPFVLTEDQEHLRREIRDFAAREIGPNVLAWDEASEFPLDVVKKLGKLGLLGVIFPSEYGGSDMLTMFLLLKNSQRSMDLSESSSRPTILLVPTTFSLQEMKRKRRSTFRAWPVVSGWRHGDSRSRALGLTRATRARPPSKKGTTMS
jgi:hypothetical protein